MCVKAIKSNISNEVLNFSTNNGVTLNELFNKMANLYIYSQKANYLSKRDGDIKDSILLNEKVSKVFPNIQYTRLEDGLKNLMEYSLCKTN